MQKVVIFPFHGTGPLLTIRTCVILCCLCCMHQKTVFIALDIVPVWLKNWNCVLRFLVTSYNITITIRLYTIRFVHKLHHGNYMLLRKIAKHIRLTIQVNWAIGSWILANVIQCPLQWNKFYFHKVDDKLFTRLKGENSI